MRVKILFSTILVSLITITSISINKSRAIQLQDGTVYFAQPPRLLETITTYNRVNFWGATYYFTISLPENAGEPLQKITINQHQGVDNIRFDLDDTFAFTGTRRQRGQKFKLKEVTRDRKSRTISLTFDQPIPPGTTMTIGLKPHYNPAVGGVYLFGVTAFPAGEKSHGQFLGYGRLHFYSPSIDWFW